MLIEIHAIQNHSPANLNRDDIGAPKTCYFGGVLRSRISSQCLKRSIRTSEAFKTLCGGVRTRQLARLITERVDGTPDFRKRAAKVLENCGIASKNGSTSDMLVYTTNSAINQIAELIQNHDGETDELTALCGQLIEREVAVPDMALSGRMLETGKLKNTTVEASLQVAHAISTHEARAEVDYFVAADDIPGDDAGAGYLDETMYSSACFYKYFSIHWQTLLQNLSGYNGNREFLAAHTVGAFLRGAVLVNPTGKQNSFAAHNPPDGVVVEIKDDGGTPISYANAFAAPVPSKGTRDVVSQSNAQLGQYDVVSQSIAQLGQYMHDLDTGYGKPGKRFWFSPNLRHSLGYIVDEKVQSFADVENVKSLDELIQNVVGGIGFDWDEVRSVTAVGEE